MMIRSLPGLRLAAATTLLLLASCASTLTRAEVGSLVIDNKMPRAVGLTAVWEDESQGHFGSLEGILPAAGAAIQIHQHGDLPAGVTVYFAVHGAGFDELLKRNGVEAGDFLPSVIHHESVEIHAASSAFLTRSLGSEPGDTKPLEPAQLSWVYPGGEVHLVLEDDGYGGIRISERLPRR